LLSDRFSSGDIIEGIDNNAGTSIGESFCDFGSKALAASGNEGNMAFK
jgi:hypothetical protein